MYKVIDVDNATNIAKDLLKEVHEVFLYDKTTGEVYKVVEDIVHYQPTPTERLLDIIVDEKTSLEEKLSCRCMINSKYGVLKSTDDKPVDPAATIEDVKY